LMQCCPDCTPLFEQGRIREAKALMHRATMNVLHNLCLASFYKHKGDSYQNGKFLWADLLEWIENDMKHCPINLEIIKEWKEVYYWINPSTKQTVNWVNRAVKNYNAFPRRSSGTKDMVSLKVLYNNRFLYEPVRWLAFLSILISERRRALMIVRRNIATYLQGHKKKSKKENFIMQVQERINIEGKLLQDLEKHLPSKDTLDNILNESKFKEKKFKKINKMHSKKTSNSDVHLEYNMSEKPREYGLEKSAFGIDVRKFPSHETGYNKKDVIIEGYLRKQTNVLKIWKRHWFVLQNQFIYAFSTEQHQGDPLEIIDLRLYSSVYTSTVLNRSAFILASTHNSIIMECSSQEECIQWMKKINIIIETYETLTNGVHWNMVIEIARVFGFNDMDKKKANKLAPQLGHILQRLGFTNKSKLIPLKHYKF